MSLAAVQLVHMSQSKNKDTSFSSSTNNSKFLAQFQTLGTPIGLIIVVRRKIVHGNTHHLKTSLNIRVISGPLVYLLKENQAKQS